MTPGWPWDEINVNDHGDRAFLIILIVSAVLLFAAVMGYILYALAFI